MLLLKKQTYVNEIFYSTQGEGANVGRPAVFLRFSGCNLWSGKEEDRATAKCKFCDTNFVGGKKFDTFELADKVESLFPSEDDRFVVVTGGEPTLQLTEDLIDLLHDRGITIAIETNGTRPLPNGIDWICVSPKAGNPLVVTEGDELKVVYPQKELDLNALRELNFSHYWLQPMAGKDQQQHTAKALAYCLKNPGWKLSLQTHKILGIA